jgi:hypothetical protein
VAEDVVHQSVAVPHADPAPLLRPGSVRAEDPRVYRWRFGIAYIVLAVLAGAGIGAAVMVLDRPEEAAPPAWSEWRPVGRTTSYARQIAESVSPDYRTSGGAQLAAVIAGPPTAGGLPVQAVVIRHDPPIASAPAQYEIYAAENTVAYTMCGGAALCSLDGDVTADELYLLRRQALELSLYTFKYVADAEATVVLLPPDIAGTPEDRSDDQLTGLYFKKKDFARELARPLRTTLPGTTAAAGGESSNADLDAVERLTRANIFEFRFDRLQNDAAVLMLTPLNARP